MEVSAVPSLRSLCITFLAQNIRRLPEFYTRQANVQPLDTSIIMEIVTRAGANMTEESAVVLEALSPYLEDSTEFDLLFWKPFVEKNYYTRDVKVPYNYLEAEFTSLAEIIVSSTATVSEVTQALHRLDKVPFSWAHMKASNICKVVNNVSKQHNNENIKTLARKLTDKWKSDFKKNKEPQAESAETSVIDEIHTWRDLYFYSHGAEERKFAASAARFSEHRSTISANKHLTQTITQNQRKRPLATMKSKPTPHKSIRATFASTPQSSISRVALTASNIKTKTVSTATSVMQVPRHLWEKKMNSK